MKNNSILDYDNSPRKSTPFIKNPRNVFWLGMGVAILTILLSTFNDSLSAYTNYYILDVSYYIGAVYYLILLLAIFRPKKNTQIQMIPIAIWGSLGTLLTNYLIALIVTRGFWDSNILDFYPVDFLLNSFIFFMNSWVFLPPIIVVSWWQRNQFTKAWLTDLPSYQSGWLETLLPTFFTLTFLAAKFSLFGEPMLVLQIVYTVVNFLHLRNYYAAHRDWEFEVEDTFKISLLLGLAFVIITCIVYGIMQMPIYWDVIFPIAFSACLFNVFLHYFFPKLFRVA